VRDASCWLLSLSVVGIASCLVLVCTSAGLLAVSASSFCTVSLQAVEIRELIIRCLSQMVLARVNNVKSGWKSMFMVFTTAAGDPDPTIVRLAFDTIEKIVREHFGHITGVLPAALV
jgi:hypothetical protein